ncbi:unnamed protein product [Darwinula stevensoni]|uniref:SAM domain-containing protein n=1 Tax=Darwinula stevensoni TaxID=69355 RepID=A0A7R8XC79_9CRUS|nr:unnamed protein product [Darwinula stevensoni]CAG0885598.1 unnamed protein product [Darwinula stevensoni]
MSNMIQLQEMEMKGASGGPEYERKLLEVVHSLDGKLPDSKPQDGDPTPRAGAPGHPTAPSPSPEELRQLKSKYSKAKRIIRELAKREKHWLTLVQDRDTEYETMLTALSQRVATLTQTLADVKQRTGLQLSLPTHPQITPLLEKRLKAPTFGLSPISDLDFSDLDSTTSDTSSHDEESSISSSKASTTLVGVGMNVKEELDRAVPPTQLLDVSAQKQKAELASRGSLANRQLPSMLRKSEEERGGNWSDSSTVIGSNETFAYSSSAYSSTHSYRSAQSAAFVHSSQSRFAPPAPDAGPLSQQLRQVLGSHYHQHHHEKASNLIEGGSSASAVPPPPVPGNSNIVPASLVQEIRQAVQEANARVKRVLPPTPPGQLQSSPDWRTPSATITDMTGPHPHPSYHPHAHMASGSPQYQGRYWGTSSSSIPPPQPQEFPVPRRYNESSNSSLTSPSSASGSSLASPQDASLSSSSLSSLGRGDGQRVSPVLSHVWQSGSITDWGKEQVCQWLLGIGMECYTTVFLKNGVTGQDLVAMDTGMLKALGVAAEDRKELKKRIKELRSREERERKELEKERKLKERQQKKAAKQTTKGK